MRIQTVKLEGRPSFVPKRSVATAVPAAGSSASAIRGRRSPSSLLQPMPICLSTTICSLATGVTGRKNGTFDRPEGSHGSHSCRRQAARADPHFLAIRERVQPYENEAIEVFGGNASFPDTEDTVTITYPDSKNR